MLFFICLRNKIEETNYFLSFSQFCVKDFLFPYTAKKTVKTFILLYNI